MGFLFPVLALPVLGLAFVAWAVATRRLPDRTRRRRWPRPSCSRAASGRWSGRAASPVTSTTTSHGGGPRLPRSGCWPSRDARTAAPPATAPRNPHPSHRRPRPAPPRSRRPQTPRSRGAPAPQASEAPPPSRRLIGSEDRRGLARLPRTPPRRHRLRRPDRDGLVRLAAGPDVAPSGRAGLVVLRGPGRPFLHPGAARRGRGRVLLHG